MREVELKNRTMKMLARLNAPRAVTGNPEAAKSEAEFLCKRINGLAPTRQYSEWFDDCEETLLGNLETRSWPTAKEISKAAKEIAPKRPQLIDLTQESGYKPDPLKINANRIQMGQPVDEKYITGSEAQILVNKGLVTEDQLQPYRECINSWTNY